MMFGGFDARAVELLAQLPEFDETRYAAERELLASGLRAPGALLIQEVAARLSGDLTVDKRSSVSPLHRDLRFAPAGSARYKDHLMLTTWQGADKKTAPTLWLRLTAESVGFASGMAFTPEVRTRFREAVAGPRGEALASQLAALAKKYKRQGLDIAGDRVKKVPRPWGEDHPRADLLKLTGFQVRFPDALPKSVTKPAFADYCEARLRDLWGVHTWLVRELTGKGGEK